MMKCFRNKNRPYGLPFCSFFTSYKVFLFIILVRTKMPCESLDLGFVFQNFLERIEEDGWKVYRVRTQVTLIPLSRKMLLQAWEEKRRWKTAAANLVSGSWKQKAFILHLLNCPSGTWIDWGIPVDEVHLWVNQWGVFPERIDWGV